MSWKFTNERPIFQQLNDILLLKIVKGDYPPGAKLETVRELALTAGVNPNTVQRALAELENTGILFTKRGDGRYITDDQKAIEQLKTRFVSKKAETFVSSLKELGLDNAAIVTAVKNSLQESKGDDS